MSFFPKQHDSHTVRNSLLDEQHKQLQEIGIRASKLLGSLSIASTDFHDLLSDFTQKLREHFDAEESALASNRYPYLAKHIAEHDEFCRILANLRHDADNGQFYRGVLLAVIADYTDRHLLTADMACKDYLKAH